MNKRLRLREINGIKTSTETYLTFKGQLRVLIHPNHKFELVDQITGVVVSGGQARHYEHAKWLAKEQLIEHGAIFAKDTRKRNDKLSLGLKQAANGELRKVDLSLDKDLVDSLDD